METDTRHPHDAVAAAMLGNSGASVMPQGEELDEAVRLFQAHHEFLMVVVPIIVTYCLVMRCCFGAWSINSAAAAFRKGESFEQRYNMAFDRRGELTSQMNEARIHKEEQRLSTLRGQLAELDEDIDLLEDEARSKGKGKGRSDQGSSSSTRKAADELRQRRAANPAEA